jgi:hypothetical protein
MLGVSICYEMRSNFSHFYSLKLTRNVTPICVKTIFRLNFAMVWLYFQLPSSTADASYHTGSFLVPSSASLGKWLCSTFRSLISTFRIHIHLSLDLIQAHTVTWTENPSWHAINQVWSEPHLAYSHSVRDTTIWQWQIPSRKYCISQIRRPLQLLMLWTLRTVPPFNRVRCIK